MAKKSGNKLAVQAADLSEDSKQILIGRATARRLRVAEKQKVEDDAKKEFNKAAARSANRGGSNLKAEPIRAMGPDGHYVMVDAREGRFMVMLRRQKNPWQPNMVRAAQRFERSFAVANYSIKSPSYAPKVDSSGGSNLPAPGIVARMELDQMRERIGSDRFVILELFCGLGFTLAELAEKGIDTAQSLGQRLAEAITVAAAFYERRPSPPTRFFQRCDDFLKTAALKPVARKRGGNRTSRHPAAARRLVNSSPS